MEKRLIILYVVLDLRLSLLSIGELKLLKKRKARIDWNETVRLTITARTG